MQAFHRRLFALTPCRSAVSPFRLNFLDDMGGNGMSSHSHKLSFVSFLICCQGSRLAPLRTLQGCMVDGVSSTPRGVESRPPTHQPQQKQRNPQIKTLIFIDSDTVTLISPEKPKDIFGNFLPSHHK